MLTDLHELMECLYVVAISSLDVRLGWVVGYERLFSGRAFGRKDQDVVGATGRAHSYLFW